MTQRYDVVLFGATGFTGRQTSRYFADHAPSGLRWAIAGRSADKLEAIARETSPTGVIVADSADARSVDAMVAQTRVMLSTAGPFSKYGTPVVAACVEHGTDYVDITGETPWVREMIDQHHELAAARGTRIVPFCGFDSIPSDIGVLFAVEQLRKRGQDTRMVSASFTASGGLNGGTLASALTMAETGQSRAIADTLLLNPLDHRSDAERGRSRDLRSVIHDDDRGVWLTPFFMAAVNTRVVRRSNALFDQWDRPYGPSFTYREAMEVKAKWKAVGTALGLGLGDTLLRQSWGRAVMRKLGPAPGDGPSDATMDGGFFRVRHVAVGEAGAKLLVTMRADGDPGNGTTVKMVCESALLLATQRDELPGGKARGGVLTPATALGLPLVDRLTAAGIELSVNELS